MIIYFSNNHSAKIQMFSNRRIVIGWGANKNRSKLAASSVLRFKRHLKNVV